MLYSNKTLLKRLANSVLNFSTHYCLWRPFISIIVALEMQSAINYHFQVLYYVYIGKDNCCHERGSYGNTRLPTTKLQGLLLLLLLLLFSVCGFSGQSKCDTCLSLLIPNTQYPTPNTQDPTQQPPRWKTTPITPENKPPQNGGETLALCLFDMCCCCLLGRFGNSHCGFPRMRN